MTQAPMTASSQSSRPASGYMLKVIADTWLKLSTDSSSTLPDTQKQFVRAGTILPVESFERVANNHIRFTLGTDKIGQKIHIRGRNTWYAYQLHVQILQDGTVVSLDQRPTPSTTPTSMTNSTAATYTLKITVDTWLKQSTAQGSTLPDDQRQFVEAGTVLPISSFARVENNHLRVAFGLDEQGNQVQFKGRNTWYVYQFAAQVLRNGQVVSLGTSPVPAPAPAPAPVPVPPAPTPSPTVSTYALKATADTWLKQSTAQSTTLPDSQKQFIRKDTVLPISSFARVENDHLRVSLGRDRQGNQLAFKGRNTWYVYRPAVQILRDSRVVNLASPVSAPSPSGRRQINARGLRLLKTFEGLRLNAYRDPVGIWTIGYGTTSGVYPGMRITEAEAEALLKRDLARFERAVEDLVTVPLNDDQFSALVSFVYNVGEGALASSTLLRLLNRGDYRGAADQLLRWNRAGGRELAGLTRRRRAERALFLGQDYTVFL